METILLIDGKNTTYRAWFAYRGSHEFVKSNYHPFVMWLRLANMWIEKFKPTAVHVFWDCPKNDVWRKRVLAEYKDNRNDAPHYSDEVQIGIRKIIAVASDLLPKMGVRQYSRPAQECDDLIYSACEVLRPSRPDQRQVIIISSDSDFVQIQWAMPHVRTYDPKTQQFAEYPTTNPIIQKVLAGDKSDNVDGYRGIGPVKGGQLANDYKKLAEFLNGIGEQKFKRNIALIDMSMNPSRLNNMLYIIKAMAQDVLFDKAAINELAIHHRVLGFMSEYGKIATTFKKFI